MSMHIEWDTAKECAIEVLDAAEANEDLRPDEEIEDGNHILILGGAGGGALAIEGTIGDLKRFAELVATQIDRVIETLED